MSAEHAVAHFERHRARYLDDLRALVRIPSVSFSGFDPEFVSRSAEATATLLRHSLYSGVMASTDDSDGRQIKAIAASPWCPGCRGYKRLLRSTYARVSVKP